MATNMDQPSDRLPMVVGAMSLEEEPDLIMPMMWWEWNDGHLMVR